MYDPQDVVAMAITDPQNRANMLNFPVPSAQDQEIQPAPITAPTVQAQKINIPPIQDLSGYGRNMSDTVLAMPQRQDYNPGKLRTVLNAIAGGFAGAAGHPEIGMKLRDQPFNNAIADWKTKFGAYGDLAKQQEEQQKQ